MESKIIHTMHVIYGLDARGNLNLTTLGSKRVKILYQKAEPTQTEAESSECKNNL